MSNGLPQVIDLFSGCGGLSLGFQAAGFSILGGIDVDETAVDTAAYNLSWRFGFEGFHLCCDIRHVDGEVFSNIERTGPIVVVGGPPCQAYSLVGRAKLRSLGREREHTNDHRGYLFEDFIRFAEQLDADVVVMENVPESIDYGGLNVPEHIAECLNTIGYRAKWTILNAADYGVPQVRERVFVVAFRDNYDGNFCFPVPTHAPTFDLPSYVDRQVSRFHGLKYFVPPPEYPKDVVPWVTVEEALSDLPVLFSTAQSRYRFLKPSIRLPYKTSAKCEYQRLMRSWYGTKTTGVTGHCFRRNERDFRIFERMQEGDDYSDASVIADKLLAEAARAQGVSPLNSPAEFEELRKKIVPPYSRTKFLNKWKRLTRNQPSHTLTAHLGIDTYSHIHPWEPRGISVREAARLQSFPDEFLFLGSMNDAFRHIGNAVPPLLAKAIADQILVEIIRMERGYALHEQTS
ncbi:MAG TPA: DNA cytosine methyltransferase [Bacillota bacterium]|nr:DNA cytosine methyltransferase [Bacillota bacterium]HPT61873.1 DNA cytosine methyltransferase [Bacillota bacterium]